MKKYINKLYNYTLDIIGFILLGILAWIILSTLQIALGNPQENKNNHLNLFVFAQNRKAKLPYDIEITTDDEDDDEENQITNC